MDASKLGIALAAILTVVLSSFTIWKINTEKVVRYRQACYPVIAVIYAVTCICSVVELKPKLIGLAENETVKVILDYLSPNGRLEYTAVIYLALAVNAAIFIGFAGIKLSFKLAISRIKLPDDYDNLKGAKKAYWFIISWFYDIDYKKGCPLRKWVGVQITLKYASWMLSLAYLLFACFAQLPVLADWDWIPYDFLNNCVRALYILPSISLIIVNEFRWFLDGKDEFPDCGKVGFSKSDITSVTNYNELEEQYKQQFPKRYVRSVKAKESGRIPNFFNDVTTETKLEKAVTEMLSQRGITVSSDYISCINALENGQNILCDASVYSEIGEYIFAYMNAILARGENVLFICADDEDAEILERHVLQKFAEINNYCKVWLIRNSKDIHLSEDADILITTPRIVLDDNAFIAQAKFINRLSTVVLSNTAEIAIKDGPALNVLAHRLRANGCKKVRYVCLSESVPLGMPAALKHILCIDSELHMCSGYQTFDNTNIMLWNYEASDGTPAQDNLFGDISTQDYLGVELPIACVGLKYMADKISVIPGKGTPYMQISGSFRSRITLYKDYFTSPMDASTYDKKLHFNHADNVDGRSAFIVAEDSLYNLPLAIYNYARYGGSDTSMIHIISKPYMMRDYFAAKAEDYICGEAEISMIVPAFSDTSQTVVTRVLCDAAEGGIDADRLLKEVSAVSPDVNSVDSALMYCLEYLCPDDDNVTIESCFAFRNEYVFDCDAIDYVKKTVISLKENPGFSRILKSSSRAVMDIRGKKCSLSFPACCISQNILPSQSFVSGGYLYTAVSLDLQNGIVHAVEAPDQLNSPVDYIQVRQYMIAGELIPREIYPVTYENAASRISSGYDCVFYTHSKLAVDTLGYYSLNPVAPTLDLMNGPSYRQLNESEADAIRREYSNAEMVLLRIKGIGAEKSDRTAFLLAVMLNEIFKTVFPYSYNCIAACPILSDKEAIYGDEMGGRIKNAYPQVEINDYINHSPEDADILIIEDSICDIGTIRSILKDSQYPFSMFFNAIDSYLSWLKQSVNMSKSYLCYGADHIPDCFDVDTLSKICNEFKTQKRGNAIKVDLVTSKGQCSYCHRDLFTVSYTEMNDNAGVNNRKLCEQCAKLIVKSEKELLELYAKVRNDLCKNYGITLPDDITVKFATAESIRKRLHTGDLRVVIGFADGDSRELWVESDAPRANVMDVLAHELTHFWQFDNLKCNDLKYIEGHASYVEVQYMRSEHRKAFADWQEDKLNNRSDEYGKGFRQIASELSLRSNNNPFEYMQELFGN